MPHFTMNSLHCWISSLWLLLCLTACTWGATSITGFEGQDIILPCKYNSGYNGVCDVCWMRGNIPNNGCGTQIIYANEKEVVERDNVRYQLNGALKKGDASLTIRNARQSDSGKYGCRIHVPGWFNDIKIEVYLEIRKATTTTTTTHIPTHAHVSTMQHETTTIPETTTKHTETQTYSTPGYVTTTTPVPTEGLDSTIQDETSTIPENVTTERAGPVSTMHEETTTVPEYLTTNETETQQTSTTLRYVTTTTHAVTHGPDSTIKEETTTVPEHVTTKKTAHVSTMQHETTTIPETTTKHTGLFATTVISEGYPDPKFMNEDTDVLPAILVPVLLISLGFVIFAVYLMSKHKGRFSSTLEIAKTSSSSVSYSNLANSVTLPMTDSTN